MDKGEEKAIVERREAKKVTKQNCKNGIIKERKKSKKKSLMYVRGAKENLWHMATATNSQKQCHKAGIKLGPIKY